MAHIGFTPQSEHTLGGYRVQGRGDAGDRLVDDALAVEEAGAFAVVMEMVPGDVAAAGHQAARRSRPSASAPASTATARCWSGRTRSGCAPAGWRRFVKQYADVHGVLLEAAQDYAADVAAGTFPGAEHTF